MRPTSSFVTVLLALGSSTGCGSSGSSGSAACATPQACSSGGTSAAGGAAGSSAGGAGGAAGGAGAAQYVVGFWFEVGPATPEETDPGKSCPFPQHVIQAGTPPPNDQSEGVGVTDGVGGANVSCAHEVNAGSVADTFKGEISIGDVSFAFSTSLADGPTSLATVELADATTKLESPKGSGPYCKLDTTLPFGVSSGRLWGKVDCPELGQLTSLLIDCRGSGYVFFDGCSP